MSDDFRYNKEYSEAYPKEGYTVEAGSGEVAFGFATEDIAIKFAKEANDLGFTDQDVKFDNNSFREFLEKFRADNK